MADYKPKKRIIIPLPDIRRTAPERTWRLRLIDYCLPGDILPCGRRRPGYVVGEAVFVLGDGFHLLARVLNPGTEPKLLEIIDFYDTVNHRKESPVLDDDLMDLMSAMYHQMAPAHVAKRARQYAQSAAGRN